MQDIDDCENHSDEECLDDEPRPKYVLMRRWGDFETPEQLVAAWMAKVAEGRGETFAMMVVDEDGDTHLFEPATDDIDWDAVGSYHDADEVNVGEQPALPTATYPCAE